MRQTMQVGELFSIIAKRKIIVTATTVVCVIVALLYSLFLVTPVYRANTTLLIGIPGLDFGTISVNQMMAVTYGELVSSRSVLQPVIDELDLKVDYENLRARTKADVVGTTEIITISVKDPVRQKAIDIANNINVSFMREINKKLGLKNITIIDPATAGENTVNSGPVKNSILAALIGLVLGTIFALIAEYTDHTISTESDIENYLDTDIPVIGEVPNFNLIKKNLR